LRKVLLAKNFGVSSEMRDRILGGVKWNIVEAVTISASNFLTAIIAARLLGLNDFGSFSIVKSTVYMMSSVAGLGLGVTATKHIAELRNENGSRLGSILGICSMIAIVTGSGLAAILVFFAPDIALHSFNAPELSGQLRIAAFYIFFVAINGYQIGALIGFESFKILAKINLIQAAVMLLVTYFFTLLWGLSGAAFSLGISALCNWWLNHKAISIELKNHQISMKYDGFINEKEVLKKFTMPAALGGIIGSIAIWGCNALVAQQTDGLVQIAIFTAAYNFRSLILFVPSLLTRVVSPILCNLLGENQNKSYSQIFSLNIAVSIVTAVFVGAVLMSTASYFLALFGKGFTAGTEVAIAIIVMSIVEVTANAFYQPLLAHGLLLWEAYVIICRSLILLSFTYLWVGQYGALGLAYAYILAHIVSLAIYIYITYRVHGSQKVLSSG